MSLTLRTVWISTVSQKRRVFFLGALTCTCLALQHHTDKHTENRKSFATQNNAKLVQQSRVNTSTHYHSSNTIIMWSFHSNSNNLGRQHEDDDRSLPRYVSVPLTMTALVCRLRHACMHHHHNLTVFIYAPWSFPKRYRSCFESKGNSQNKEKCPKAHFGVVIGAPLRRTLR